MEPEQPTKEMLTPEAKAALVKQQYRVVGSHSAVKVCGWTKNMLRGRGGCYKLKFYGILSHRCLQMTPSMSCANRCVFCWRGYKAPVGKRWTWDVDDPDSIFEQSIDAQRSLLTGFGGHEEVPRHLYEQSLYPRHVALSLSGEPIIYPRINELLERFNKEGISTFMVTNAQYPEAIRKLAPVTQLYVSLDAPNKELLKKIDVPLFQDYWERLNESLELLAQKPQRTCIRITAIKDLNMLDLEGYAALITKGDPDFVEVKSYMHVGASRKFLGQENMPLHEEIVTFTKKILQHLPNYELVAEHIPSRVVMVAKKEYRVAGRWMTWIDFAKWHDLVASHKPFTTHDYARETPHASLGISGKGTPTKKESIAERARQRERARAAAKTTRQADLLKDELVVDEETAEMEFWEE